MLLADLASCSQAYSKTLPDLSNYVRQAHKMVLPDDVVPLVQHVRTQPPATINHLRRLARPPFPIMFVEASLGAYVHALNHECPPERERDGTGLLVIDRPDQHLFECHIIDSVGPMDKGGGGHVLNWPIRFSVSYDDAPHPVCPDDIPDRVEHTLWGYHESVNIAPLHRRGWAAPYNGVSLGNGAEAMRETQGAMRYAIALLALLNGPAELEAPDRSVKPRSMLLFRQPRKAATPSIIRIDIPKRVKHAGDYVLKHAREGTGKRLHDVRGHWRVVTRRPLTSHAPDALWEPCEGGWRRWIASHERGNIDLGDLRGRVTVLH